MSEPEGRSYLNFILFLGAASAAVILFLIFHPQIAQVTTESPIIINIMFVPALVIGILYGMKISEKAIRSNETRSPFRRSIIKIFLFFFIIGGLFSSVGFALNGGSLMPESSLFEDGLIEWGSEFLTSNGSATFLIVSSITLMASATRRIVGLGGPINRMFTVVGTFIFFTMMSLSFTQSDPSNSEVYLYTFYQAGVIGGALYQMNRLTHNLNHWEDYMNGGL
jgi:hypothetical protein